MLRVLLALTSLVVSSGCGGPTAPTAPDRAGPRSAGTEDPAGESTAVATREMRESATTAGETGPRHLAIPWSALADPHGAHELVVRTDMDWEALFQASPPDGPIDFQSSLVLGLVEANVQSVRIREVRVEGGEVVVMATVGLPNPRCGPTPDGSADFVVVDTPDLPIRFDIERSTTEC